MSFPEDDLPLVVEMFTDDWVTVTDDFYGREPMRIERGLANETTRVAPSTCDVEFDNRSGDFHPDNPMGQYYPLFGRNTPVRVAVKHNVEDTFSRTVVDGWGNADTGQPWTLSGSASNWDVGSGVGTRFIAGSETTGLAHLSGLSTLRAYEVTVDVTAFAPAFGDVAYIVALRGQTTVEWASVRLGVGNSGSTWIYVVDTDRNTILSPTVALPDVTTGVVRIRALVDGQTIWGKAWNPSDPEPADWQVHASSSEILTSGWPGLGAYSGSGNSNQTFTYDNFTIRDVRFTGEFAELAPRWDETGEDAYVLAQAAGIMRRLGQGKTPARSTPRRYVNSVAPPPLAYFPLEDGQSSDAAVAEIGSGIAVFHPTYIALSGLAANQLFGKGTLASWLPSSVLLRKTAALWSRFPNPSPSTVEWNVDLLMSFDGKYDSDQIDTISVNNSNPDVSFAVVFHSNTGTVTLTGPAGSGFSAPSVAEPVLYDGNAHHIRFRAVQISGEVGVDFYVDGTLRVSGQTNMFPFTYTLIAAREVIVASLSTEDAGRAVGHKAIYNGAAPTLSDAVFAMLGRRGEAAGRRMERLCEESGVGFSFAGNLDATAAMGPQANKPLLELLLECAEVDLGILSEPRGAYGLEYRTHGSLITQAASATVAYADLAPPFEPTFDDQATRNQITAKRSDGGSHTASQATGALSTLDPPDGVGVYDSEVTVNVASDTVLPDIANWLVHIGTYGRARVPQVTANLARREIASVEAKVHAVRGVGIGDRFVINGIPTAMGVFGDINQLVLGTVETLDAVTHSIAYNTVPADPYDGIVWDDLEFRWDSDATELTADISSSALSMQGTSTDGLTLWTTAAAHYPMQLQIGIDDRPGEVVTVSAVSGASSPQTFTITQRSLNGVVRGWPAGSKIRLAHRFYWRLS